MRKYKIEFDNTDKMIPFVKQNGEPDGEKSFREVEIDVLKEMLNFQANGSKELKTFNLCLDLTEQLSNLTDEDSFIEIDDEDLKNLQGGFKISGGNGRPRSWNLCVNLFAQIEKPVEVPKT